MLFLAEAQDALTLVHPRDVAYSWLTYATISIGIIATLIHGKITGQWSKENLFFVASNAASAFILMIILIGIYIKPEMAIGAINNNRFVVTLGLIYALWDNIADIFKRKGPPKDPPAPKS